jgi:hypothetical protein
MYGFYYCPPIWAEKRRPLGIYHDKVPAMAFNMLDPSMKVPYPKDLPIKTDAILKWFDKTISGGESAHRSQGQEVDKEIKGMLNNTVLLTNDNFSSKVLGESTDHIVFFFNSDSVDEK